MRIHLLDDNLILDPEPLSVAEVRRQSRFRMRFRRYVQQETDEVFVLKRPASFRDFQSLCDKATAVAAAMGETLHVDPAAAAEFEKMRELAEEHYRLGNEIKRKDPKLFEQFETFEQVVSGEMVRPLKDRQMWDAFFQCVMAKAGNFSVPGSGKTASVLGTFAYLSSKGLVKRLLVVCPKSAFDSWRTEFTLSFDGRRRLRCVSTQDDQYKRLSWGDRKRFFRTSVGECNLILVNYESSIAVASELAEVASHDTLLVFDEVHRVKRVNGKQANAALEISRDAKYTLALTGTPLPNTYEDLYNFLHILYPIEYDNFFGFERGFLKQATESEQAQVNERIQPFYCRTTKTDLRVPPADPDAIVEAEMGPKSDALLQVLKMRYRKNKLTLMLRVLQLENDARSLLQNLDPAEYRWLLEVDEKTDSVDIVNYEDDIVRMIKSVGRSPKRDRCVELCEGLVSEGKPVIIWCIFRRSMFDLRADLKDRGIEAKLIYGDVGQDERTEILNDFRSGGFDVLITNPQTLAESVSLHSVCHDAIYYEYSFNLVHNLQSRDRINRLGLAQGQYTQYYYLAGEYDVGELEPYSLDLEIYDRLEQKNETMLRAIDADLIEIQPTTRQDLDAIFEGLF